MRAVLLLAAAFAASVEAFVVRAPSCSFGLNALGAGGADAVVGEFSDGELRAGGGLSAASFQLTDGALTTSNGNGCIASPTTTQLECLPDTTSNGFSLACDGTLLLNNNTHFFECSTPGDEDQRKLYVTQPSNNTDCFDIVFGSQDCLPACPSSSSAASPTPTSTTSATPTPSSTSPYSLTQFRPPSLILPLSSTSPSRAPGTSYDGIVNSTTSSVFVFDFDSSYSGSTCALTFLLPPQADLTSSSYTLTGPGGIDIALLAGNADEGTTFNNKPGVETDYGVVTLSEGTASRFASSPCPVGTEISYELSTKDGTSLVFFEDSANPAVGLYISIVD